MDNAINLWPLLGILTVVVGFIVGLNPLLVVIAAGLISGLLAHLSLADILEQLGSGFLATRNLALIFLLPLGVIGLLERHGLKEALFPVCVGACLYLKQALKSEVPCYGNQQLL